MDENQFSKVVETELTLLYNILDDKSEELDIEVDFSGDVIYITTATDQQFVINRHTPTKQIWLSSPKSGASYFLFDANKNQWPNKSGEILREKINNELNS